mmetsp:Transcript_19158/g.60251  ORF Transcript_19158/g.60251 Transcript_19158/m.60251 type:complete len:215 (+) Transcript_19158:282-926(+)
MRRKMYIKHLQHVAEKLKDRHDELNSKMAAPPPDGYTRQRETARRFFEMRGECIVNQARWLEVVTPTFTMTLPTTPYDNCPNAALAGPHVRILSGPSGLIDDCLGLRNMLADLADKRASPHGVADTPPRLTFEVDPGSIVHVGDTYVCHWTGKIAFVEDNSTLVSISHTGMAKCCFAPDHRIASLTWRFDVLAFVQGITELAAEPMATPALQQH